MESRRQELCEQIIQWNEGQLDMFTISEPDENLECHGVVRFYYRERDRSATKCLRISSATTSASICAQLLDKFHADAMLALQPTEYALFLEEVQSENNAISAAQTKQNNKRSRKMDPDERPLLVQLLNMSNEERNKQTRFVLMRVEEAQAGGEFARAQPKRFSKRQNNRQRQQQALNESFAAAPSAKPSSAFTRTISNPEHVLKRRRLQRAEQQQRQSAPDFDLGGGIMKIYGVELFPNRPYVTLLVRATDSTREVLAAALQKYGVPGPIDTFMLVQVTLVECEPSVTRSFNDLRGIEKQHERVLHDLERPLELLGRPPQHADNNVAFFLRRRPPHHPPSTLPKSRTLDTLCGDGQMQMRAESAAEPPTDRPSMIEQIVAEAAGEMDAMHRMAVASTAAPLPCLVPINTLASTANFGAGVVAIQPGVTEIGSSSSCAIQLRAPSVLPRHCCLINRPAAASSTSSGPVASVSVALLDKCALVELNGASVHATVELQHGVQLRIGGLYTYRFFNGDMPQQRKSPIPSSIPRDFRCPASISPIVAHHQRHSDSALTVTTLAQPPPPHIGSAKNGFPPPRRPVSSADYVEDFYDTPLACSTPGKKLATMGTSVAQTASLGNLHYGGGPPNGHQQMPPQHYAQTTMAMAPMQQPTLPILIECLDQQQEDALLHLELFSGDTQRFGAFRLAPAFVLYALCRHRVVEMAQQWELRQRLIGNTVAKFIDACSRTIKANLQNRDVLVFWLANASELFNMVRADVQLAQSAGGPLIDELGLLVHNVFALAVDACAERLCTGIQAVLGTAQANGTNGGAAKAPPSTAEDQLIAALDECMRCVRCSLLNSALTIQLFSQLFHFISVQTFNWLVHSPEARPHICLQFGLRLKHVLFRVHEWAEQQGLELAAECHMDVLAQTVNLLVTPKTLGQIAALGATCYRLNSVQVRYLLEHYVGDVRAGECGAVAREVIEHVVDLARAQADQMAGQQQLQLGEPSQLQLPFLIPHDGYVIEKLRGIPPDMAAFVGRLQQRGIARVLVQQPSPQLQQRSIVDMPWSVHLQQQQRRSTTPAANGGTTTAAAAATLFPPTPPNVPPHHQQQQDSGGGPVYAEIRPPAARRSASAAMFGAAPNGDSNGDGPVHYASSTRGSTASMPALKQQQWNERLIDAGGVRQMLVERITLRRSSAHEGLGLSIVEVATTDQQNGSSGSGIYVKSVIAGSAADQDGRLGAGDQLLSVNGHSLMGVGQQDAAQRIGAAGPTVHFEVAKRAAHANGIGTYFGANGTTAAATPHQNGGDGTNHTASNGLLLQQRIAQAAHGAAAQQQPPFAHSQQSSTSSLSTGGGGGTRLPPHYRPSANRPQVVLQPSRPASSSPLNSRRSHSSSSSGTAMEQQHHSPITHFAPREQQHHLNIVSEEAVPPTAAPQTTMVPMQQAPFVVDYAQLPLIGGGGASPPINASSTTASSTTASSTGGGDRDECWAATVQQIMALQQQNAANGGTLGEDPHPGECDHFGASATNMSASGGGRRSAPLFGATEQQRHFGLTSAEEVERELDRLDSMEAELLGDEEQRRYRALLSRLAVMRASAPPPTNGHSRHNGAKLLPASMAAAAAHLERQSKSLAALSLDSTGAPTKLAPSARSAGNLLKIKRVINNNTNNAPPPPPTIEEKQPQNGGSEETVAKVKKQPPAVPAKPAIRELVHRSPPDASFGAASTKKRVQFQIQNNENISLEEPETGGSDDEQREEGAANGAQQAVAPPEPRVQIVGAHEVYVGDPRQRRLQELQANQQQKAIKPVDSSVLGFREKMRIFAEQLGEKEPEKGVPLNQHKSSSAERRIHEQEQKQREEGAQEG